ncbi:hypothetical protein T265_08385 [Opisthorchis viverrini]|uniref:2Fe-2S ferredoxin-type domain-containing protein n=1 Tax=Opisthorchis viverrini TaxID=6198 RepID=A0A074ZKA7_OPIVI|nr:hypothetical protein T265_08385 [Opisthorchis viverrini]KER23795.1 hypothetical protein T265_08385 [Opisthorchis viverrini]
MSFYRTIGLKSIAKLHTSVSHFQKASRKTVPITFVWKDGRSKTVNAKVGDSLLDVVLDQNVGIDGFGACEGTLACSTCHLIFSPKDYENLKDPLTEEEQDMLDLAFGLTDTSRLGCQVIVTEDMPGIKITVPEGIYDVRAPYLPALNSILINLICPTCVNSKALQKIGHEAAKEAQTLVAGASTSHSDETQSSPKKQKKGRNFLSRAKWKKRRVKKLHTRKQRTAMKNAKQPVSVPAEEHQEKALEYLHTWDTDQEHWKFRKNQQTWLINHVFNPQLIPRPEFRIFLQYVKGLVGSARQILVARCEQIMNQREPEMVLPSDNLPAPEDEMVYSSLVDNVARKRAKSILKRLSKSVE